MTIIKNGILGGFSGKVGNVVGVHSRGQDDITGERAAFNAAAERADSGYARLRLPEDLRGKHLDIYLAFVSEDRKRRSNSQYLGLIKAI